MVICISEWYAYSISSWFIHCRHSLLISSYNKWRFISQNKYLEIFKNYFPELLLFPLCRAEVQGYMHYKVGLICPGGAHFWLCIFFAILTVPLASWGFPMGFPAGSNGKESACNIGGLGSIPGSGRPPGEGNSYPFQHSCPKNSMDREAWWAIVHRVPESDTTEGLTLASWPWFCLLILEWVFCVGGFHGSLVTTGAYVRMRSWVILVIGPLCL